MVTEDLSSEYVYFRVLTTVLKQSVGSALLFILL
jgi:hypothetical protein